MGSEFVLFRYNLSNIITIITSQYKSHKIFPFSSIIFRQNKLECLSRVFFELCLIFAGKWNTGAATPLLKSEKRASFFASSS